MDKLFKKSHFKSVNLYRDIILYLSLFFILANIVLIIISGFHNAYIYVISIVNPILLFITTHFFEISVKGFKNKSTNRILKRKEYVQGFRSIITSVLSIFILIIILSVFVFIELWVFYWLFKS